MSLNASNPVYVFLGGKLLLEPEKSMLGLDIQYVEANRIRGELQGYKGSMDMAVTSVALSYTHRF